MPRTESKITVCHIASGDLWAGAEAQIAGLLRALACNQGLHLLAIVLNEGRLAEQARRCCAEVEVIPEHENGFLQILKKATAYLRARNVQILHSHRYKENLLSALLAWRCRVPYVVRTRHGLPEAFKGIRHLKHRAMIRLDRLADRYLTKRVISVSAEQCEHLVKVLPERKLVVIRNGLDLSSVGSELSPAEAKKRLGIDGDCPVLGYAGRLEPIKRLDIFLAAAAQIAGRVPESRFVIAGEGSEGPRLRNQVSTQGLQGRVLFLGHRSDIHNVLRAFDIFVLTSDHEGLPMVLLEALYLGVPVVARAVGGIPEVIENGLSGILLDSPEPRLLADACERLLRDVTLRARLSRAGIERVADHFSVTETARQVGDLYLSLIQTP
jgi:glycosyltransferase involved in cell wall biosynthesis